jgi:hypothetical protein
MTKRVGIRVIGALVALGGAGLVFWSLRPGPAVCGGKPLTYWRKEFKAGGLRREKAEQAFRTMGTNAIPFLLVEVNEQETALHRGYCSLVEKLPPAMGRFLPLPKETAEYRRARVGVVLADIAAPATSNSVVALRKTLDDPFHGARNNAVVALGKTAPKTKAARDAVAALIYATTDTNYVVRGNAYFSLRYFAPEAVEAVPVLERGLEDPEIYVRRCATNGLAPFLGPVDSLRANRATTISEAPSPEEVRQVLQVREAAKRARNAKDR